MEAGQTVPKRSGIAGGSEPRMKLEEFLAFKRAEQGECLSEEGSAPAKEEEERAVREFELGCSLFRGTTSSRSSRRRSSAGFAGASMFQSLAAGSYSALSFSSGKHFSTWFSGSERAKEEALPRPHVTLGLTLPQFVQLLLMPQNTAVSKKKLARRVDYLSEELPHYWVCGSHNSFLVGHQLTSQSSADMYRRLLLQGVSGIGFKSLAWQGRGSRAHQLTF